MSPHRILILVLAAAVIATTILLFDSESTSESAKFVQTPAFVVWLALMAAQLGACAIVLPSSLNSARSLEENFVGNKLRVGLSAVCFVVLFSVPSVVPRAIYLAERQWPLAYHGYKMLPFAIFAMLVALLIVTGILLVDCASRLLFRERERLDEDLTKYFLYREQLDIFLRTLGGLIALAALSLGALRKAVISVGYSADAFPPTLTLAYGGYFTALVALVYLPAMTQIQRSGTRCLNFTHPTPSMVDPEWNQKAADRQTLRNHLRLDATPTESLRSGLAIGAPLLAGALSLLLQ